MKISIIIPYYEKYSRLRLTLQSLSFTTFPFSDFEVVICNDGCEFDKVALEAGHYPFQIRVLTLEHGGRAWARNAGIMAARGKVIVLNDDDTLLSPDFLHQHWYYHKEMDKCIVLGCRKQLYLSEEQIRSLQQQQSLSVFLQLFKSAQDDLYTRQLCRDLFHQKKSRHWLFSITSNFSVCQKWLKLSGGFDERFSGWGFEDIELGYRLSKMGLYFYYDSELVNYHLEHPRNRKEMIDDLVENIHYFYQKYNFAPEISLYWDLFRGKCSLEEFDQMTYRELNESKSSAQKSYFTLFKHGKLQDLNLEKRIID